MKEKYLKHNLCLSNSLPTPPAPPQLYATALIGFPISCGSSISASSQRERCNSWMDLKQGPEWAWLSSASRPSKEPLCCLSLHESTAVLMQIHPGIADDKHKGSCIHLMPFIKRPNLILTKTLADEVRWRLQDFCGLGSCFVLHSCASPSRRAVPAQALRAGRADRAAIIRFVRACLEPRAQSVGHPGAKIVQRGARLFFLSMPLLQKHSASCGFHVLSGCCKICGDTFPPLWWGSDAQPKAGTNTKPLAEEPKSLSAHQHCCNN